MVLVVGGTNGGSLFASAQLYDPGTGLWSITGSLHEARDHHVALLLPNGKVLVVGGKGSLVGLTSAEVYDPASGLWTNTGALNNARSSHTATFLPDVTVLVAGGFGPVGTDYLDSAELYDPAKAVDRLRETFRMLSVHAIDDSIKDQ